MFCGSRYKLVDMYFISLLDTVWHIEQQKIGQKINVFVYKLILMDNVFV